MRHQQPKLLSVIGAEPEISHRTFVLEGPEGTTVMGTPVPEGQIAVAGPSGGALFITGGNDFYPAVRVEAWSAEPRTDEPAVWEATTNILIRSTGGILRLRDLDGSRYGAPIDLGSPGTYHLSASCRGRQRARLTQKIFYRGIEEWLLQIWPSCSCVSAASATSCRKQGHRPLRTMAVEDPGVGL